MKTVTLSRETKETDICLTLNPRGSGQVEVSTGIGFFDHMLTALAFHARFDLKLTARGDLCVDDHHTVEDVGILLGKALREGLESYAGLTRYGSFYVPMDEALGFCSLDLSNRGVVVCEFPYHDQKIGAMDCAAVAEFFKAFGVNAGITLHLRVLYGENDHHKAEALFKAAGNALRIAMQPTEGGEVLSTKGVL